MSDFKAAISFCVMLLKQPFTIWDFTLNWWDIGIWTLIAGIIIYLIVRFLNG